MILVDSGLMELQPIASNIPKKQHKCLHVVVHDLSNEI